MKTIVFGELQANKNILLKLEHLINKHTYTNFDRFNYFTTYYGNTKSK
ncbi:UNVERIFIED_CONTAM: hypothetical protein O8I53_06480 [Campylobacter lari]